MPDTIRVTTEDGVTTIVLDRPNRLNAMTHQMIDEVLSALETAAADDEIRLVVMTGAGRAFCAGGDLSMMSDLDTTGPAEGQVDELRREHRLSLLLREMPKVTLAAINGPCAGAGLSWACAADLRIAARSAVFRTAFISAGVSGDFGGTWTLPRLVGDANARALYLLNEKLDAERALDLGLVHEVVDDDLLEARVAEVAAHVRRSAPLAVGAIKANLNEAFTASFAAALDSEAERHVRLARSADAHEAARAFIENREGQFVGS